MPADQVANIIIFTPTITLIFKVLFTILFILYFIFSLIVVRQVQLMTDTLITEVSPLLRSFSILHAGLALGVLILFIGFF